MLKAQKEKMNSDQTEAVETVVEAIELNNDSFYPHPLEGREGPYYAGTWARDVPLPGEKNRWRLMYDLYDKDGEQITKAEDMENAAAAKLLGIIDYHNGKWQQWTG